MASSEKRYSGRELKEYVNQHLEDWRVITRKPTNHHCLLINRKSGYTIERPSNWEMMEYLTNPNIQIDLSTKSEPQGFELEPYNDIFQCKSSAQKAAEYAIYWIEEAGEFQAPNQVDPTFRLKRNPKGCLLLVVNGVEYGKP